jgi:type II restriction enzyme
MVGARRRADFYCSICSENYELKSRQAKFGDKVDDGAYRAMLQRVSGNANPNLFLLNYSVANLVVTNLTIVPKHFLSADMIEERKPLPATARRAGWIGCRILLRSVPYAGRIAIIRNGIVEPKAHVLAEWKHTMFLRGQRDPEARGWLLRVMRCIERLGKRQFNLEEIYAFEDELSAAYPSNRNNRPKIRQKLQVLRDNGYLKFVDRGLYRLV